jgi:hypothetical protein
MLCAFCSAYAMDARGSKESLSRAISTIKKEISRKKKNGEDTTADMEKFFELGRGVDRLSKGLPMMIPGAEVRESVVYCLFFGFVVVRWLVEFVDKCF